MSNELSTVCGIAIVCVLFPLILWVVAAVADHQNHSENDNWLDQPGDDAKTGWTNFDYIAATELLDDWQGDE